MKRVALKSPSETDQIMHVKKLPEARKITPEKIEGLACATHTGPDKVLVPPSQSGKPYSS